MFKNIYFLKNEKLSKYSTINIGGKAKYIVFPRCVDELKQAVDIAKQNEIKFFILGNGSNVLFDDNGFDGAVICLKKMKQISRCQNKVVVSAGISLFELNFKLKEMGLTGLEWSFGIPATIGGFVYMNGGCFGHEICEFVDEVEILKDDKIELVKKEGIGFGYRHSNLDGVIVGVTLNLAFDESTNIWEKMNIAINEKRKKQPCDKFSLGSVFKQIHKKGEVIYPAKMIDSMGLKGVKIGGAEISTKHAGFFVNTGNATSSDYKALITFVKDKLADRGVFVESEIVIVES